MTQTNKRIMLVIGGIVLFIAGLVAGGGAGLVGGAAMTVRAAYNIAFVQFDRGLITNRMGITGNKLFCTIFSLEESVPDHVGLEYRDMSNKVVGSDVVYLQRGDQGVMFLETTIKDFSSPVSVHVKRP